MTFFNFTASHDGIGVRPLEGLVPRERVDALVDAVRRRGGLVSTRRAADGTDTPYELNVTYFSALDSPEGLPPEVHARKFLASQGLMLAVRGVPGIYFHSLVGTPNDHEGVEETGKNRSINRQKFEVDQLRAILGDEGSAQRMVFDGYQKLLSLRAKQPAFHPDAEQTVVDVGHDSIIAFVRVSQDRSQRVLVLANVGDEAVQVDLARLDDPTYERDLLSGRPVSRDGYELESYDIAWLA
jgi:sucrose phosphorylase